MNAILNKNTASVEGCRIYVGLFPCNECAKLIIQSGIIEVIYVSDKYHNNDEMIASRKLLDMARVKCRQYIPPRKTITIDYSSLDSYIYDIKPPLNTSFLEEHN
jgi:dCMP deaminase